LDGSADITVLDDAVIQLEASDAGAYPAPDVVVISADLAGSPAIERMRALRERWVRSHVVVLATHFREQDLAELIDLRRSAYLLWGDLDLSALLQCNASPP